jgi:hypothetical protein
VDHSLKVSVRQSPASHADEEELAAELDEPIVGSFGPVNNETHHNINKETFRSGHNITHQWRDLVEGQIHTKRFL